MRSTIMDVIRKMGILEQNSMYTQPRLHQHVPRW